MYVVCVFPRKSGELWGLLPENGLGLFGPRNQKVNIKWVRFEIGGAAKWLRISSGVAFKSTPKRIPSKNRHPQINQSRFRTGNNRILVLNARVPSGFVDPMVGVGRSCKCSCYKSTATIATSLLHIKGICTCVNQNYGYSMANSPFLFDLPKGQLPRRSVMFELFQRAVSPAFLEGRTMLVECIQGRRSCPKHDLVRESQQTQQR